MSTFEYEPLLATNNNVRRSKSNTAETTTTIKTYLCRARIVLFCIVSLISAAIIIYALSAPEQNHSPPQTNWVQMEQSQAGPRHVPSSWSEKEECTDDHAFTLTLALKQENTDLLDAHITDVSDPHRDSFHQYWDKNKVRSYFKPSPECLDAVLEWLSSNGFAAENNNLNIVSEYGNVITLSLSCAEANTLLNAKYMLYENKDGLTHLHVEDGLYNIPEAIYEHIDFISPTIRFPLKHHTATMQMISTEDVADSETYNTPERLYELYSMTEGLSDIIGNVHSLDGSVCRQAILSTIEQYYSDDDLQSFWDKYGVEPQSEMERYPSTQPQGTGAEAELDTQYITSTGKGVYTYVYYMDDEEDPFISLTEAILTTDIFPFVVSMSYGANENDLGQEYVTRANQEFGKLALIGVTMFASSGDSGVKGDSAFCEDDAYNAAFPASAPYVTSVGGTQGGITTDEIAWSGSGGGFSQYFDAPHWQKKAIRSYFKENVAFPDESRYVSTGRAYPDVSAQAVDFIININAQFYTVSGTSASSPTVAGMISMINYKRIESGKSSLGFINPVLYSLCSKSKDENKYFNDVTEGYNVGCEVDNNIGFYAADGWDPVTGLGTPIFTPLYQALLDMD